MKRLIAVVCGIAVGYSLYMALTFGVLRPIQNAMGGSPEEYLGVAFLLLMPLALFFGGFVCGCIIGSLSRPSWLMAFLHSPGLYISVFSFLSMGSGTLFEFQISMLVAACVWILISSLGVVLGVRLRMRRATVA